MQTSPLEVSRSRNRPESDQYVSFMLGGEEFGASIACVQEIKGWDSVTRVPHSPRYILGVVNLRGAIVPVIDLRIRFGLSQVPYDATTVIVVVRVAGERGERTVGIVVDAVNEVHSIPADGIRPAPHLPGAIDQVFIQGIAPIGDRLVMLLDIDTLVNASILGRANA